MNPQYPEQNPYDFIMNPNQPPPKRMLDVNSKNGFILKIALIIGGLIVVMVAIAIITTMLTGSKTNTADLKLLAQTQQEVIRVSNAQTDVRDQTLKNVATNIRLSVGSHQTALIAYLAKNGAKINPKELGLKRDAQTDARLSQARATSTYDIAMQQVIQSILTKYATEVQTNYNNATDPDIRTYLQKTYEQTQLLQAQMPAENTGASTNP